MPGKKNHLIAEFSSGVNAPVDSATFYPDGIDVSEYDVVLICVDCNPGNANAAFKYYTYGKAPGGGGIHTGQSQIPALQWHAAMGWGPGGGYSYNGMVGIDAALPGRIAIAFDAPGAGVSITVRVFGQRIGFST